MASIPQCVASGSRAPRAMPRREAAAAEVTPSERDCVQHTEASMLALLRERHAAKSGNGPEWAYIEKVRDAPGFDAKRTADALALSLWRSRGHELHGFEVKISRGDWRRELADPAKAEGWCMIVDRWWIAAPRGVVPRDELPATWGLLETGARGLTVTVRAPLLREDRLPIERELLVPILRAAGAALVFTPDEAALKEAREQGWNEGRKSAKESGSQWRRMYEQAVASLDRARQAVAEIERVLGVSITEWVDMNGARAARVAAVLRVVLDGDDAVQRSRHAVESAAGELERHAASLRRLLVDRHAEQSEQCPK